MRARLEVFAHQQFELGGASNGTRDMLRPALIKKYGWSRLREQRQDECQIAKLLPPCVVSRIGPAWPQPVRGSAEPPYGVLAKQSSGGGIVVSGAVIR